MANNPAGAPTRGSSGQQQKQGLEKQDKNALKNQAMRGAEGGAETEDQEMQKDQAPILPSGTEGEDRTPDKTIGQIAHASKSGGAGDPETTPLEPEKHGGIGGP